MLAPVGGNRPFAASTVPKMKQFAENVRECEAAQSTISSIWHEGIKGFLKELKIIENGIPSECFKFWAGLEMLKNYAFESVGDSQCGRYWVPVLNYFWLQSMLLLLMMHLFYLLVFASFFLIMERYSSKKNTSSVYTLHHCSDLALDFKSSSLSTVGTGNKSPSCNHDVHGKQGVRSGNCFTSSSNSGKLKSAVLSPPLLHSPPKFQSVSECRTRRM